VNLKDYSNGTSNLHIYEAQDSQYVPFRIKDYNIPSNSSEYGALTYGITTRNTLSFSGSTTSILKVTGIKNLLKVP
jgi:hypothetical protein